MSKRWGKSTSSSEGREEGGEVKDLSGTMFPVECSGEDCSERTSFLLPGDSPYQGGMFLEAGWTALAAQEMPALTFLCKRCFEREVVAGNARSEPTSH
ncbi:MAG: hypothetical protein KGJ23_02540 [Euryarchaeota archaeon]|nr:hypothetical protein [Euryarchaeota archaeon]MDE2045756.1 hypothetical protein [Thermoplasmata archaeon]